MLLLFYITLFINSNAGKDITTLVNNKVVLDGCNSRASVNTTYEWIFTSAPSNFPKIKPNGADNHICHSSFTPTKAGIYEVILLLKNRNERSEDRVKIIVLNSYKKKELNFNVILGDNYYSNDFSYYEDNVLSYDLFLEKNRDIKSQNGKFYIEEFKSKKKYLVENLKNFHFKKNRNYSFTYFSKGYKKEDKDIVSDNIELSKIKTDGIDIEIQNHKSEKISGIYTAYYKDKTFSSINPKVLDNEYDFLLFLPNKKRYNYPSIYLDRDSIDSSNVIKYNKLEYHYLTIKTDDYLTLLIESENIDNCLENLDSKRCSYEKRVDVNIFKKVHIPRGEYKLFEIRYGKKKLLTNLFLDKDKEYIYESYSENKTIEISLSKTVKAISFYDGNRKVFFKGEKLINIEPGIYDIVVYTDNGYYNLNSFQVNSLSMIPGSRRTIFFETGDLFWDYFIFENGYYVFTDKLITVP